MPRLLRWHNKHKRDLLWRSLRRKPYVVLVSEYMLQQTGVRYIEKRLPLFLKQFPTVKSLSSASQSDVLRAWQGLGYNRRALFLHRAAKALAKKRSFPNTLEDLMALPGIGRYTASAVLCFAMKQDVPVVDVNIERVISRIVKRMKHESDKLPMKDVWKIDESVLPIGRSAEWHEALMDLGSSVCTKRSPKCEVCPLNKQCKSAFQVERVTRASRPRSEEKKFFGEPQRIWRGRMLQAIAAKPIREQQVIDALTREFEIEDEGFAEFVKGLIARLQSEDFVQKHKNGTLSFAN